DITATLGITQKTRRLTVSNATHLVINEVDYDNVGTPDSAEFVEVYNPTPLAQSTGNLAVVLVNGSGSAEDAPRSDLSGLGSIASDSYVVLGPSSLAVAPGARLLTFAGPATDIIQNGAPDGLALVNTSSHTLIDALSYEGSILSATLTGFPSPVSLV